MPETPQGIKLTEVGMLAMRETLVRRSIPFSKQAIADLSEDPSWVELFNQGFIFVGHIDSDVYKKIEAGQINDKETQEYSLRWYFKPGVERRTIETVYTTEHFGQHSVLAVFARETEGVDSRELGETLEEAERRVAGFIREANAQHSTL